MGEVHFYHLTRTPREAVLPVLIARARDAGWRVEVRGTQSAAMQELDMALWLGPDDAFLPHGLCGGPHDALQPVLLTAAGQAPAPPCDCVLTIDGAAITQAEIADRARVCILFDGGDPAMLAQSRALWKACVAAGCVAKYWSQESGRWEMKAQAGQPAPQ